MKHFKKLSFILSITLLTSLAAPCIGVKADATATRKLCDVQVFKDTSIQGWAGSGQGELEVASDNLPIDTSVTYNNLPSLKINVTKDIPTDWWKSIITIRGWMTQDLTQYKPNGYLEFNIKGKAGGEKFKIGADDMRYERAAGETISNTVNIQDYVSITTDWQHVKIPLKDILDSSKGFDPSYVRCINVGKGDSGAFTAWINDLKITSPDNEKSYPAIKVNQVGYLTKADKYALVTGFSDVLKADAGTAFEVKDASGSVVYSGKLTLVTNYDPDSGEKVLKADFSTVNKPGTYYVSIPSSGIDDSLKFKIGDDIFKTLLTDAERYFYYQRQGIELKAPYCTDYPRTDKTPNDAAAKFQSGMQPAREIMKGWYDAGDKGKYINNGALAISEMFWAYEMFPETLKDNQFNIPESGNGVADILDEARWELEWILKMQDSASGGFYARVQSENANDADPTAARIIKDGTTNLKITDDTACAAAILSHAYIMYKDTDADFANKCLTAAKSAWTFLEQNSANIQSPPGPYNVSDDSSDRLWASASLYRATGDNKYHTYFKNNYSKFASRFEDASANAHQWGNMWTTAFWCYLKADNKDTDIVSWVNKEFNTWVNNKMTRSNSNPWQIAITQGSFYWGSNSEVLLIWEDAILGSKLLGTYNDTIGKMAQSSLNWILGMNPLRKSFVSGYGEDSLKTTFHTIYSNDGKSGIPNGYLSGGPNKSEGVGLSNFPAKCFQDSNGDWVTNENCLNWNAPLVFISSFVNSTTSDSLKLGDLNADGSIDSIDLVTFKKVLLGQDTSANLKAADLNGDGNIDAIDFSLLKQYLLKIITKFPAEK